MQLEAKIGTVDMFHASKDFYFRFTLNGSPTVFTPFTPAHISPPLEIVAPAQIRNGTPKPIQCTEVLSPVACPQGEGEILCRRHQFCPKLRYNRFLHQAYDDKSANRIVLRAFNCRRKHFY